MMIIEILFNNEEGVLFKSEKGYILVPEEGFQPGAKRNYSIGTQAIPDEFWDRLVANGRSYQTQ